MARTPIKRHESLKKFSREHHHGLLLSWKIRAGLKMEVDASRMKAYTDWFWKEHLEEHFQEEEKWIFPILPADHELLKQVREHHKKVRNLFESDEVTTETLDKLQSAVDTLIRFEERELFNAVQEVATESQLQKVFDNHSEAFLDNYEDEFWVK